MINNRQQNGRNNRRGRNNNQRPMGGGGQGPRPDAGNRIDSRQRGNAHQLHEKYKNLARDSQMQGDRVTAEYYLQFADHYFRVLNEHRARQDEHRERQRQFEPRYEEGDEDADGTAGVEEDATAPLAMNGLPPAIGRADSQPDYEDGDESDGRETQEGPRERSPRGRGRNSNAAPIPVEADSGAAEADARPVRRQARRPATAEAVVAAEFPAEPVAAEETPAPRRRTRRPRSAENAVADADA